MIAWNPKGDVKVGPLENNCQWSGPYLFTAGACYVQVKKLSHEKAKAYIFIEAMHLIVRDRVDPDAVHREFWKIDEYRDGLSEDFPKPKTEEMRGSHEY